MARRSKKTEKSQSKLNDYVVVCFAEDVEEAKDYEALLKSNDIPVTIKSRDEHSTAVEGIAVMVPEQFLDEAYVVIESQDGYDDLYEFSLEGQDEDEDDDGDENQDEDDKGFF